MEVEKESEVIPRSRSTSPVQENHEEQCSGAEESKNVEDEAELDKEEEDEVFEDGPEVVEPVTEEFCRTNNIILLKKWNRGLNSCSRTDLEFGILPESKWFQQRKERLTRPASGHGSKVKHRNASASAAPRQLMSSSPGLTNSAASSAHKSKEPRHEDKMSPVPVKRRAEDSSDDKPSVHGPPASGFLPVGSSLPGRPGYGWPSPHYPLGFPPFGYPPGAYGPLDHPALRGMYPSSHDPTPALRQLSEYAKPHIGISGGEALRPSSSSTSGGPGGEGGGGLYSKITGPNAGPGFGGASGDRPGSRTTGNSMSHGDRDMGGRESASSHWEDNKDRVKQEILDQKPINADRVSSRGGVVGAGFIGSLGLPPLSDGQLSAELHKRYMASQSLPGLPPSSQAAAAAAANSLSSLYQPSNLAADWFQRERMEMLGIKPGLFSGDPSDRLMAERLYAERLNAERMNAERTNAERLNAAERLTAERLAAERFSAFHRDPLYRPGELAAPPALGRSSTTSSATEQSHTHTHSHTHLHLHQPDAAPLFPAANPAASFNPLPLVWSPHLAAYGLTPEAVAAVAAAAAGGSSTASATAAALQQSSALSGLAAAAALQQGSAIPGLSAAVANPHAAAYSVAASQQLVAAAQEQEMIFRELMCRPPYSTDPVLAQQLMAQAFAQQEAIQRQLAVERERLAAILPHHPR